MTLLNVLLIIAFVLFIAGFLAGSILMSVNALLGGIAMVASIVLFAAYVAWDFHIWKSKVEGR